LFCFCNVLYFDWPFRKNIMILLIHPKYKHFLPIWGYGICSASFQQVIYDTITNLWPKDIRYGVIFKKILDQHSFCLTLSRIYIPNFTHHHFWLRTLQELGYSLWFILITLIGYYTSQSTNVFKGFLKRFKKNKLLQWATLTPKTFYTQPLTPL